METASQRAHEIYQQFLTRIEEGAAPDLEGLVRLHPDLEIELRSLHKAYDRIEALLEGAVGTQSAVPGTAPIGSEATETGSLEIGYELIEEIGSGASGRVMRARDLALDTEVAIKILSAADRSQDKQRRRFLQEARDLARIRHENVVRVMAVDEMDGEIRLVMELIEGRTLDAWVRDNGPLSAEEAAQVGISLCRALAALHQAGLVHMDLKPANVMRAEGGRYVLLDFGLVRSPLSQEPGRVGGTPPFMAPEHLGTGELGPATDIFGLGATLYWLVSGEYPYAGGDLKALFDQVRSGAARPLSDAVPSISAEFAQIIERAMRTDTGKRYRTAGEMERALRAFVGEEPSAAASNTPRRWMGATLAGVAATALVAAGLLWFNGGTTEAAEPFAVDAQMSVLKGEEELFALDEVSAVAIGDRFSLTIQIDEPAYVYLFNEDEAGLSFKLAPKHDSQLLTPGRHRMPGSESYWRVTTAGGTEHMFLIASREPNPWAEALLDVCPSPTETGIFISQLEDTQREILHRGLGEVTGDGYSSQRSHSNTSLREYFEHFDEKRDPSQVFYRHWEVPHDER